MKTEIQSDKPIRHLVWGWLLLFLSFAVLFGLTCSRAIQWQDSGHFVLRIATGQLVNELGLALSHPLHYWLGRVALWLPFEPPHAVALVSALFGAITVANVFGCVFSLTGRRLAAVFAAVSLGLANTFWRMSTIAEVYTISTAVLGLECWLLVVFLKQKRPWPLVVMMFVNGLGFANHNLALLSAPILAGFGLVAVWRKEIDWQWVIIAFGAWCVGSLPFTSLIVQQSIESGQVGATVHSALFGNSFADEVMGVGLPMKRVAISGAFTLLSFPNLLLPIALIALLRFKKCHISVRLMVTLVMLLGIHLLFVIRYNVIDQHTFYLPVYTLLAILGGIGFAAIAYRAEGLLRYVLVYFCGGLLCLTPAVYYFVPVIAKDHQVLAGVARGKPYRDDYQYLFWPWAVAETSADQMSRHAVKLAGPNGLLVLEDSMGRFAVEYQLDRAGFVNVKILDKLTDQAIAQALGNNDPVVVVPAVAESPPNENFAGQWRREGDLYVLELKENRQ